MQMGPKEIAVEYRTAANKQKQIKVLAELNQCQQRDIVEILVDQGEEVAEFWREKLAKPRRQRRKPVEETPSVTAASGGASEAGNVARSPRVGISLREETPSVTAASGGASSLKEGAKVPRTDVVFSLSQLRRVILETLSEESPSREDLPGFVTALTALERRLSGLAGEEV